MCIRDRYYGLLANATPDMSHTEQTTLVLRYLLEYETEFKIAERFLCFVACNIKTGKGIANLIVEELKKHNIPLVECSGQGYNNSAKMAGLYNGAQAIISVVNPLALFSNCEAHSLNLCGNNAAEWCEEVVTFFGMVEKTYNSFARNPQRWEILEKHIGCSLHSISPVSYTHLDVYKRQLYFSAQTCPHNMGLFQTQSTNSTNNLQHFITFVYNYFTQNFIVLAVFISLPSIFPHSLLNMFLFYLFSTCNYASCAS